MVSSIGCFSSYLIYSSSLLFCFSEIESIFLLKEVFSISSSVAVVLKVICSYSNSSYFAISGGNRSTGLLLRSYPALTFPLGNPEHDFPTSSVEENSWCRKSLGNNYYLFCTIFYNRITLC